MRSGCSTQPESKTRAGSSGQRPITCVTLESSTYPQNGTGLLDLSIKNVGGDTASNVASLGVTLAPGITYVSTTIGPAPNVAPTLASSGALSTASPQLLVHWLPHLS